ncbi:MAG: cadherin-like beta sandwich domain-containing protein [Gammaproteobacteria bacterium]|nr:cadherin-like beta sandwich domain-containing protein [Gammaproteobacteria bacterium]
MRHVDSPNVRSDLTTHVKRLVLVVLGVLVASCSSSNDIPTPTAPVLGNDATLSSLSISGAALDPAFSSSITDYSANVAHDPDNIDVSATTSDDNASVAVNGGSDTNVALVVGENTISILVTAEDSTTTRNYTVIVTRAVSGKANLYQLQLTDARMVPYFEPGTFDYSATVQFFTAHTQVEAWTSDTNATITVNGSVVASGSPSDPIALSEGSNTVLVRVTAEDGASTQTYAVTVVRPSASLFVGKAYIKAPDLLEADHFGSGVALSGDGSTLAVGSTESWLDYNCGEDVWARAQPLYVYARDSGGDWTEQPPVLLNSSPLAALEFELSADGSRMALIRRSSDDELFVLDRMSDGQWSEQPLEINDPPPASGTGLTDVTLSEAGDTLAVGMETPGESETGAYVRIGWVVIFTRDSEGAWTQQASIREPDADLESDFANVIALSGDGAMLAVGAAGSSVYVFTRDSNDTWAEQAQISASYLYHREAWSFGDVIALSSDGFTLAAREYYNGTVYMYTRESNDVWIERQRLRPVTGTLLGGALVLSADGSTLAAGQFIYDQNGDGDWVLAAQANPWTGDPGYLAFDVSLSADGTTLVLGAPGDSTGTTGVNGVDSGTYVCNSGAAYLFER